ncbi:MAG: hypothetical protein M3453_19210 [Pseudomonadota bacterium]|nr:hypothetical protein [Pseudomonadota bacterium]
MKRLAMIGAALALLMTTGAFAQTNPPPVPQGPAAMPPVELQPPPGAEIPGSEPGGMPDQTMSSRDGDMASDDMRQGRRDRMRPRHRMGPEGWRDGGPRGMGEGRRHDRPDRGMRDFHGGRGGARQGAEFTFSQGNGGPSITIRCANRDTTLECANAIMPMLEQMLPAPPPGAPNAFGQ